jgi:hypothetical protein
LIQTFDKNQSKEDKKHFSSFNEYVRLAEIYMAYNLVNQYVAESYRSNIDVNPLQAEGMFNAARFLANALANRKPPGINSVYFTTP